MDCRRRATPSGRARKDVRAPRERSCGRSRGWRSRQPGRGAVAHPTVPDPRRLPQRKRGRDLPGRQAAAAADRHHRAVADRLAPGDAARAAAGDRGRASSPSPLAFFLPNMWLRGKISERQTLIEDPLPDAMDLLVTCVEAGLSLDAAMARVSQELELVAPDSGAGAEADDAGDPGRREALRRVPPALERERASRICGRCRR